LGSLIGRRSLQCLPLGSHGQAGDLGGRAAQDRSIEFRRGPRPYLPHMPTPGRSGSLFAAARQARRAALGPLGPFGRLLEGSARSHPWPSPTALAGISAKRGRWGLEVARVGKGCIIHLVAILDWPRGRQGRRRFLLLVVTGDNAGARNLDFEGTLEQPDAL
jgi:hypothetical protein